MAQDNLLESCLRSINHSCPPYAPLHALCIWAQGDWLISNSSGSGSNIFLTFLWVDLSDSFRSTFLHSPALCSKWISSCKPGRSREKKKRSLYCLGERGGLVHPSSFSLHFFKESILLSFSAWNRSAACNKMHPHAALNLINLPLPKNGDSLVPLACCWKLPLTLFSVSGTYTITIPTCTHTLQHMGEQRVLALIVMPGPHCKLQATLAYNNNHRRRS